MAVHKALTFTAILSLCIAFAHALAFSSSTPASSALLTPSSSSSSGEGENWSSAKTALQSPQCCIAYVPGLESHLRVLQTAFADEGPSDLDLRFLVRVPPKPTYDHESSSESASHNGEVVCASDTRDDCIRLRQSVNGDDDEIGNDDDNYDACTTALAELARGVASLADGPLSKNGSSCPGVFIRVVCASDYRARDPMYHTDKAPLRAYVTLRGVGTEFMTRPCSLVEYMTLRGSGGEGTTALASNVREAEELEFIVMKGDGYECDATAGHLTSENPAVAWWTRAWKRTEACVHRSPPGRASGGRRVILSLDLADGDDDREWYQADTKREWRAGMTQRKSRMVA